MFANKQFSAKINEPRLKWTVFIALYSVSANTTTISFENTQRLLHILRIYMHLLLEKRVSFVFAHARDLMVSLDIFVVMDIRAMKMGCENKYWDPE